ncbi:MAG TPA: adenylate/guanylate cyclase domain-containing protein [Candidatus Baltobacteraceae bacterium]|nr:adenylate/guanylate cyclase domain-containing protein [Candidatus Baltobacteraceae bacterium]
MASHVQPGRSFSIPTGTVTFLFSDIEGSTARWERNRDAMAEALARHDLLMRRAFEARGGYVFKTMGDAFCVAFSTASEALDAAIDAQLALASENFSAVDGLRVRMALHSGRCEERHGDYFGPTVNRVARLLAIGHGGQVLVSRVCRELLQERIPNRCSLRDLGAHRLKDLAHPEHVYQLVAPHLPETFPALQSLHHLTNNLPAQLSSFVGRDEVMAEVKSLLEHNRLVTLVGSGGAGKTRCAIQVGAELLGGFDDGVWLAELSGVSDGSLVAGVIARALDLQESASRPILDTLLGYLKRKRLLLIIDNCEHLIDEASRVAAAILRSCPDVCILATSREQLNIAGERVYRMPSLSVPSANQKVSTQDVLAFGAPLLFADRAISAESRFSLTDENAADVAEICRRLDGIPLAIELAAARVTLLSPKQLLQKLDERFRVLVGGDRNALPRHQTMRALIDWSYDLLSDDERRLFRKLSIFAGGFTLQAAAAVCNDDAIDEFATLELLSSLVDKSLVQADESESGTRYRLLESTRQYAREKLCDAGEQDAVARTHAVVFEARARELEQASEATPDRAWDAQAEPELENWRAALTWAFGSRGDVAVGRRLAAVLRRVWGRFSEVEGRRWVRLAMQSIDAATDEADVADIELAEAWLDGTLSQHRASLSAAENALSRYRRLGNERGSFLAQQQAGRALLFLDRVAEGEALLRATLDVAGSVGPKRVAAVLKDLAFARLLSGDADGARSLYAQALATAQVTGALRLAAVIATDRGEVEFQFGDAKTALQLADEALDTQAVRDAMDRAVTLNNSAAYLVALNRYGEARVRAREALGLCRDFQYQVLLANAVQHIAAVAALRQNDDEEIARNDRLRAARLLGYVDARLSSLESAREYTEQQEYDKILLALRDTLGNDRVLELMREGSGWNEEQAVSEAMLIC